MNDVLTGSKLLAIMTGAAIASVPEVVAPKHLIWAHLDIGVPVNAIVAAAFGSLVGVYKGRQDYRGDLIGTFLASLVMTLGVVAGIPELTGYQWKSAGFQACMAMLLGFTSQIWGPELTKFIKAWFRRRAERRDDDARS